MIYFKNVTKIYPPDVVAVKDVHLKIEPQPRGTGFEFEDAIVGGVVPGRFVPAVEKGVIDAMTSGVIAGYQVVDVKTTLHYGSYHDVDSDDMSFKIAGKMAFRKGFKEAKPILLEPMYEVEVMVPEEHMGDVMGDLSSRRGKILGMDSDNTHQIIKSLVPLKELYRYSTTLRSMTQGRGTFTTQFSGTLFVRNCHAGTMDYVIGQLKNKGLKPDSLMTAVRQKYPGETIQGYQTQKVEERTMANSVGECLPGGVDCRLCQAGPGTHYLSSRTSTQHQCQTKPISHAVGVA